MSDRPLKGVRVLELARILAGPWAGQVLADLGADILKIESPAGDDTRKWGPPFLDNPDGSQDAAYFHACNRGKRSAVIDFSTPQGQDKIKALIADADIVIENFKKDGLKKYGLDYASLSEINPKLVYCSITGFGQTGPYADRPGYDFIIQGMSGLMDITGESDGPPIKTGVAFADIFTGLYSVIAIQAALHQRARTGVGQHIDMALFDTNLAVLANQGLNYLSSGVAPTRMGNAHPNIVPYQAYPVKDGWFILAVGNDRQFERFCGLINRPELAKSDLYQTNAARVKNRADLNAQIEPALKSWTRDALLAELEAQNIPAGPINNIAQALTDPQAMARHMTQILARSDGGQFPTITSPMKFSGADDKPPHPAPALGQDKAEWL